MPIGVGILDRTVFLVACRVYYCIGHFVEHADAEVHALVPFAHFWVKTFMSWETLGALCGSRQLPGKVCMLRTMKMYLLKPGSYICTSCNCECVANFDYTWLFSQQIVHRSWTQFNCCDLFVANL